jgi:hypothetical protein
MESVQPKAWASTHVCHGHDEDVIGPDIEYDDVRESGDESATNCRRGTNRLNPAESERRRGDLIERGA